MKRFIVSVMTVLLVITSVMTFAPATGSADSLYIKKIVSVVYDDSGSMKNYGSPNWAYASYAMQAFCGLLNSGDQLYITYMSEADRNSNHNPPKLDLSESGIQTSVDSIREHIAAGNTPYSAVDIAMEKLRNTSDSNENTQYWLVVITDGAFQNGYSNVTKGELDSKLSSFTGETMANNTRPQVTYLAIGDGAIKPTHDTEKGIYVYDSDGAQDIVNVMADIADKVSGRSRLDSGDIKLLDSKTVQVKSDIPLLNIAVLSQKSSAQVTGAAYDGGGGLEISRSVSFSYPEQAGYQTDKSLVGGGFLIGNGNDNIEAGTYILKFDQDVTLDSFVVMFEPALEVRVTVTCNGKEVSDLSELQNTNAGDKISVSYNIYEVGTNNKVSLDLLPEGTDCMISISENGSVVESGSGNTMEIKDFELDHCATEISAVVKIDGFTPIEYSAEFTPAEYVPPAIVYTVEAQFGSDVRGVKYDEISSNKDLTIEFSVYADGVLLDNAAAVNALAPQITVSPDGNSGVVTVSQEGKIIFTPNRASGGEVGANGFDVTVTCSVEGVSASETYRVLLAEYEVVPVHAAEPVVKTEFYGNQTGVSFYITKDGVRLDRQEIESGAYSVTLNEGYEDLSVAVTVQDDGTIVCVPYDENEHKLNFWSWWGNWYYYFGLESTDVKVMFSHPYGSAQAVLPVVEAAVNYQILNVYMPLAIELIILSLIVAYMVRYFTKARFSPNGVLYVGSITRNRSNATHRMELCEIQLNQYNKFKNLWNPFKELTVSVSGVSVTAAKGNRIICNELFPWYSDSVRSKVRTVKINSPKDIVNYCVDHGELTIYEIKPAHVMDEQERTITQDDSMYYFVRADIEYARTPARGRIEVIDSATVFCYATFQN